MFTNGVSGTLRAFAVAGLMLAQAAFPCAVWAQGATQAIPRTGAKPPAALHAGLVNSVSGEVFMRKADGTEVLVKAGDLVDSGAVFRTGANGQIGLLFSDGQNVSLNANSTLRIDDYRFDPRDMKVSRAAFRLTAGAMRFVTGAIHAENRNALKVSMGDAVINIVSKEPTGFVAETGTSPVEGGAVSVIVGQVSIVTPQGTSDVIGVDQFVRLRPNGAPSLPQPLSSASAFFQALVTASRGTALVSGVPMDVEAAAVKLALANLPATGAGPVQVQTQAQSELIAAATNIVPAVTPGGGRGCVGSGC